MVITILIRGWYDAFLYILFLSTLCSSLDLSKSEPPLLKVSVWRNFHSGRIKKKITFLFSKYFQPSLASDTRYGQQRFTCIFQSILIYSKSSSCQYCPRPFSPIFQYSLCYVYHCNTIALKRTLNFAGSIFSWIYISPDYKAKGRLTFLIILLIK